MKNYQIIFIIEKITTVYQFFFIFPIYPFIPHNSTCNVIQVFKDLKLKKGEKGDAHNSAFTVTWVPTL